MVKIDPVFKDKIIKLGGKEHTACYNCGNCTAVCSLSTESDSFPREMVRYANVGLKDGIKTSLKPWLCYYCGECSTTCPRQANPGELMMTLRRWLTIQYDWTGLSGLFYNSTFFTWITFFLIAGGIFWFANYLNLGISSLFHYGHLFELLAIPTVFAVILLPNLIRMWYFTIVKNKIKKPIKAYFISLKDLFVHMFTQRRVNDCEKNKIRWILHLILVFGYLSLLFTTVVLDWFGTHNTFIVALGYIESLAVFVITVLFMFYRISKKEEVSKNSHPTDWFFVVWLFLLAFSSFVIRIMIDMGVPQNTLYWSYIVHWIILAQWALVIVPFGKWTHFLYRSFAMYFDAVKKC